MSVTALLVILLLVLVSFLALGVLGYAVYRRPRLTQPVIVMLTGAGALATVVGVLVAVSTVTR
ncbi:hypothetical protein QWJ26_39830 [Streptomyces sp. CSDS2]|uniref:hypothetical protein n=1 Tax=Streptomyces sp. CSDS2 TaxID=3055051 RepID=UPI0025B23030|nr:hypothetical protein [Streptomyces sp. CSDS2]MDN3265839.1 hypothetical protein [Streptomyces sp. CSDS2]